MLKFFYLFLKKFIPDRKFQLLESETDSLYFAISLLELEDCVPQHLRRQFFLEKKNWMSTEACYQHLNDYVETKVSGKEWKMQPCC